MIPIYNYLGEKNLEDDLSYGGCPYTASYDAAHWNDNATFANVSAFILPVVRYPVCQAFGLNYGNSFEMTYPNFYEYGDILVAEDFEGDSPRFKFNEDQWYNVRALTRYAVETPMDEKGRMLFITKLLRRPLEGMRQRAT